MRNQISSPDLVRMGVTIVAVWHVPLVAQMAASANELRQETVTNVAKPCIEPPPIIRLEDYQGPLGQKVGGFARKLDRKATSSEHYKPDALLCSREVKA